MAKTKNIPLGIKLQEYKVPTSNGWILSIYRIADSESGRPNSSIPLVLFHGLSTNHEIFISSSRNDSLATYLFDRGFDVFLCNNRGNEFSTCRTDIPDIQQQGSGLSFQSQYDPQWNFSIDEYAIDVKDVIDFVLNVSTFSTCSYIGYSQGVAIGLAALSLSFELDSKVSTFIGLAPVLKPNPVLSISETTMTSIFGIRSFLNVARFVSNNFPQSIIRHIIKNVLSTFLGWKSANFGPINRQYALYRRIFGTTSVKSFVHWFQLIDSGRFAAFDSRSQASNLFCTQTDVIFKTPPVAYPTFHVRAPIWLWCGESDNLSDVEFLYHKLPQAQIKVVPNYEHLDLIWHHEAANEKGDGPWAEIVAVLAATRKSLTQSHGEFESAPPMA